MASVLSVNAGSSSLKFALFEAGDPPRRLLSGQIERIGTAGGPADHASCVDAVMERVRQSGETVGAVGHRIVHGGPRYLESSKITSEVLAELRRISPFDPEHLPAEIALIEAFTRRFPDVPQVACFDTAFHRDLPLVSRLLAIPRKYEAAGCAATAFTGSRTPIWWGACGRSRAGCRGASCWLTSATARASPPCGRAGASTRRWASPPPPECP